mmetsp:Transcript_19083/g.53537  ORF Transcript_19083/g.53537 Transcript_19083/m.53537 type:complete len:746 (-) Transcript_19083:364-2601(-)|eukprot:CAMPEP_0119155594 /NCGR_PEP_ID=MMETSP1310-20130426/51828_1 /TAXON_ID=464262 /ORGANISM="Genus nov. species nov., Strain RCC2339" /LENGTH=745 /DNA_ID=CAMNT_0007148193 /DNA_START=166 /DNA_END=2403 /DNA_ORIENTATION=-
MAARAYTNTLYGIKEKVGSNAKRSTREIKSRYYVWDRDTQFKTPPGQSIAGVRYGSVTETHDSLDIHLEEGVTASWHVSFSMMGGSCQVYVGTRRLNDQQLPPPLMRIYIRHASQITPLVERDLVLDDNERNKLIVPDGIGRYSVELLMTAEEGGSRLVLDCLWLEVKRTQGAEFQFPLVSSRLLPVGSVLQLGPGTSYRFLGNRFDPTEDDRRLPVARLRHPPDATSGMIEAVLDPRAFQLDKVERGHADEPVPEGAPDVLYLLDVLWKKCCQQTIRGISLLDLFNHLSFDTGAPMRVAIVGGAVRDVLRRRPLCEINDIDVVVSGCGYFELQREIADFFASRGVTTNESVVRASSKSRKYGMLKVMRDPALDSDDLDIALCKARSATYDSAATNGLNHYLYGHSYFADALTRDYTINAIYVDVCREEVYDPCHALPRDYSDTCDHDYDSVTRLVKQRLISAPLALVTRNRNGADAHNINIVDALRVIADDIGGQFRYFKELAKDGIKTPGENPVTLTLQDVGKDEDIRTFDCVFNFLCFSAVVRPLTPQYRHELSVALGHLTQERQTELRPQISAWVKSKKFGSGVDVDDSRLNDLADDLAKRFPDELWVRKMVKKLFGADATLDNDTSEPPNRLDKAAGLQDVTTDTMKNSKISKRLEKLGEKADSQGVDEEWNFIVEVMKAVARAIRTKVGVPFPAPTVNTSRTDVRAEGMYLNLSNPEDIRICEVLYYLSHEKKKNETEE